jgi:hypothetical protein
MTEHVVYDKIHIKYWSYSLQGRDNLENLTVYERTLRRNRMDYIPLAEYSIFPNS